MRTIPRSFRTISGHVQGRLGEIADTPALALHTQETALDEAPQLADGGIAADLEDPAVVGVGQARVPKEMLAQAR